MLSLFSQATPATTTPKSRNRNREAHRQRNRPSCSTLFTPPFRNRNLEMKCLKCQLCPGTSSRTSRPSWPLLPSFAPRLLPSEAFGPRTNHRLGLSSSLTRPRARCKLAGMKDTALSAYLHRKATAWSKRFPPIHSPDCAKDPKTPQVDGGDGAGGSPEDEEDVAERPVASESSLDEADDKGRQCSPICTAFPAAF